MAFARSIVLSVVRSAALWLYAFTPPRQREPVGNSAKYALLKGSAPLFGGADSGAPETGLEPATIRLTARCLTVASKVGPNRVEEGQTVCSQMRSNTPTLQRKHPA
jgi:hypothetical protein